VERDPALARRFQVVKIDEPAPDVAIEMLRGMVAILEKHHGIEILDEAVCDAVKLSQRYITGRQLPDKAISVLDTACARVAVGQSGLPEGVESLQRQQGNTESRLRVLRHELATGIDRAEAIAKAELTLQDVQTRLATLQAKLAREKEAVAEIVALRRRIANGTATVSDDDDEQDPQLVAMQLQRLNKGLEALQEDDPLVTVCVDSGTVASVISDWTGIPVGKMMADELHTVLHLQDRMAERLVGQPQALDAIARRVRTFRADLDDPGKPVGVFMLVGPSGVGKTETAIALADLLYGGERNMVTVNMSEFQEAHSVSSLKGAPPGYVGYGRGGVLTEAVRRRPYSVVLLDEMEKAHPDVLELFFQVFDKGVMDDGEGVQIDFKNTLILLTSNAAQDVITDACAEGRRPSSEELVERLRPALLKQFSPAFLGRLVLVRRQLDRVCGLDRQLARQPGQHRARHCHRRTHRQGVQLRGPSLDHRKGCLQGLARRFQGPGRRKGPHGQQGCRPPHPYPGRKLLWSPPQGGQVPYFYQILSDPERALTPGITRSYTSLN